MLGVMHSDVCRVKSITCVYEIGCGFLSGSASTTPPFPANHHGATSSRSDGRARAWGTNHVVYRDEVSLGVDRIRRQDIVEASYSAVLLQTLATPF